jgi:hypothetical protein
MNHSWWSLLLFHLSPKSWDAVPAFGLAQGGYLAKMDAALENGDVFAT